MPRKRRKRSPSAAAQFAAAPSAAAPSAPLPARVPITRVHFASILARHAVPLAGLALLHGSVENFMVLSVFDLAFAIAFIGVIGVAVSTRAERVGSTVRDIAAAWLLLAGVGAALTLLLTAMFGWVIALMASNSPQGLWNADLGWSILAIVLAALPQLEQQYRDDVAAGLTDAQRQWRDQPRIGGNLLCAGLLFVLSGYAANAGHAGAIALALAVTALLVFRDLRPDLMRTVVGRRAP
jgi:hypothetical protein